MIDNRQSLPADLRLLTRFQYNLLRPTPPFRGGWGGNLHPSLQQSCLHRPLFCIAIHIEMSTQDFYRRPTIHIGK